MKLPLLFALLSLSLAQAARADGSLAGAAAAGPSTGPVAAADPELHWRDPRWLSRQREPSRWRYQLGVEQRLRSPVQFGPQAAVREAVWAGVSYDFTRRLTGGVESPVWERDSGWASRMAFEKPKKEGLAGLRGAFTYQLSSQSRLTLRPRARSVMVSYSATW
ncbi:MAG: hypothetical protein ACT6S0_05925 [Roseateles sp.]|uniref:hypothetical protein n=1 Tax=Roseateles sp. TaxID=1971397 RepID=UPI004036EC9B